MYRVGVDLGGTNISVGVTDENWNIVGRGQRPTRSPRAAAVTAEMLLSAWLFFLSL